MPDLKAQHGPDLAHHLNQGKAWLASSLAGANTAMLSYAALELRFAIERLALHYWRTLLDRPPEDAEARDARSFKVVEIYIRRLAGHQQVIERHFAFFRIFRDMLGLEFPLIAPNIGSLKRAWHDCSELCHITWPLTSCAEGAGKEAFEVLAATAVLLSNYVESAGWPMLKDESVAELRARFAAGKASEDEVRVEFKRLGLWATFTPPNGSTEFVGIPVPPSNATPEQPT